MQHILAAIAAGVITLAIVSDSWSQSIIYRGDVETAVSENYRRARLNRKLKAERKAEMKIEAREQKELEKINRDWWKQRNKEYSKRVADHKKRLYGKK